MRLLNSSDSLLKNRVWPGNPQYNLLVPKQAVGANLVYFDLWNANALGRDLRLVSLIPIISGAVAVTGVVGVDLHLTRTTAIGVAGTAATADGTDLTAMTISQIDPDWEDLAGVTARLTPTSGATAGAWLSQLSVFTEETNSAPYAQQNFVLQSVHIAPISIPALTGIRVVQGAVASVGNIGFLGRFELVGAADSSRIQD